ncbi:MAG: phytanoyl-CoA dioxygenase family protein [Capsulimonadales bacterium]|nr:phytanoyl-CoA dioxygenase family protein [Capsulimonadales bacterium]
MAILTTEQRAAFARDGFLLVSGRIPEPVLADGQAAMRRLLAERADAYAYGTSDFNACYTEALCAAAAELGGEPERGAYYPVSGALAILSHPADGEWTWPGPHIDHAIPEHGHKVFPRPFRLASLLYLNDVGPRGGGTVVWPGSHRKLEALAKSDPERFTLMATLNQAIDEAGIGEPQEVLAKAGDILFYDYLLAHSGSKNITSVPRFALNHKW